VSDQQDITREHRLIAKIKDWTGERLIGDDCAVLPGQMLVTADTLVENTHFIIPGISFEDLGWKSLAVNLSDIAAMCGRPRFAIVNLTLPGAHASSVPLDPVARTARPHRTPVTELDIEKFYMGLIDCARTYRCRIVGGDLTRGNDIVISITAIGEAHESGIALRSGAKAGDIVVCTGDFGASAAGLWLMKEEWGASEFEHCAARHFRPLPRLCESWSLVRTTRGKGALMDASDGLADALVQIARASEVGIEVNEHDIPINEQTETVAGLAGSDVMEWALYGGEDYELVGTIAPDHWDSLQKSSNNAFKQIGVVTDKHRDTLLLRADGKPQPIKLDKTFQHWS
jgi:thiamine-monophosphate kinase